MISCLVHTLNEEKNIGRCLKSLTFADEIVVVDMGSTDMTLNIAKSYTKTIFTHPYTGYVEPARNFAINKAKGDWIMIVDADEVIPDNLSREIIKITENIQSNITYYSIPRKNIIFNKWMKNSGWWPDYQIRLFKKGNVKWSEKIHGIPLTFGKGKDIVAEENFAIVHHNYNSVSGFVERMNRYTSIQAKDFVQNKENINLSELMLRPVNEFVKRFFMLEGYKDGMHGFALSSLQALSELVVVLKAWEARGFPQKTVKLEEYAAIENSSQRIKKYWLLTELLKYPRTKISGFFLKIRRKILS